MLCQSPQSRNETVNATLATSSGRPPPVRRIRASWIGMNRLRRMNCESEMCQRSQ